MAKQDVTVELYYSGAWQSAPAYVRDQITITHGQGDENSEPTPSTLNLTIDNRSGAYNPRNASSPLYGLIGRNTPARAGLDLAVESFGGTSASGWTPTDGGLPWTGLGAAAADFTESAGIGRHLQPLKNIVRVSLLADERRNVEQVTDASIPAVAVGASAVLGHFARRQAGGDNLWLRMEFDVGGAMTAKISKNVGGVVTDVATLSGIPGLAYTAGQSWSLRSSVSGSRLSLRVWQTGTPEPAVWTLTAVDASITAAGRYGLASWVVAGNTNTTEVRFDNYRAVDRRYTGEVSSWKPGRTVDFNPATGKGDAWTEVEAAGVLRRLGQGADPLVSALRRRVRDTSPAAYWPLEDGTRSTRAASGIDGAAPMEVATGLIEFVDAGPDGSDGAAAPVLSAESTLAGPVSGAPSAGWQFGIWVRGLPTDPAVYGYVIAAQVETDLSLWQLFLQNQTPALISFKLSINDASVPSDSIATSTTVLDGRWHLVQLATAQNGANVDAYLHVDGQLVTSKVLPGHRAGNPAVVRSTGRFAGTGLTEVSDNVEAFAVAHITVHAGIPMVDMWEAGTGWAGEAAGRRVERLCAESGVAFASVGDLDESLPMGPQRPDTFVGLLAECERTDDGALSELRDAAGVRYRTRADLYNQTPALVLDWSAHQVAPPFDPVVDDLGTRNDVTANRREGSSARAVLESGPMSVLPPPAGVGRYTTRVDTNPASDLDLPDLAGWALHKGTVDELRIPRVTVDLVASPGLTAAATAVDIGDRITITNLPADMGDDEVSLIVLGYTETIGSHRRSITFNCAPASPWDVAVWGVSRYDTEGSETTGAFVAGTGTTLTVATLSGPAWTTGQVPFDINAGGVRLTVTAVSGSTSPQTFTVTQTPVNGITKTIPAGTAVRVWSPAVYAL